MTGRIERRRQVQEDLATISSHIAQSSPTAAHRFLAAVESSLNQLSLMPDLAGRIDLEHVNPRLRAWQVPGFDSYIIFYVPLRDGTGIDVHRVLHGARNIGRLLS